MISNYSKLQLTTQQAEEIAVKCFNIKGCATVLAGEIDFNFKLKTAEGVAYILKVSRPDEEYDYLDFQQKMLQYIEQQNGNLTIPKVVLDKDGNTISTIVDENGQQRYVRLLTWLSGRLWSAVNPQTDALRLSLGKKAGQITQALQGFDHPKAHRQLDWDNAQVAWTYEHLDLFEGEQRVWMAHFHAKIKEKLPQLLQLRKSVIHNDINDNNVVVGADLRNPDVVGCIDYGDAIHTPIVNDLGVAGMYLPMHQEDALAALLPFVKGYHRTFALQEEELDCLYIAIAIRLVISLTKAALNKKREPENIYHQISAAPAWKVLEKWYHTNETLATYSFRAVCGYSPHPDATAFSNWAAQQACQLTDLFPTLNKQKVQTIDMGMESTILGNYGNFDDTDWLEFRLAQEQKQAPDAILGGGYLEARPIYTADAYRIEGNSGYEYRTIHLGTDFWVAAQTPVHAFLAGEVVMVHDNGMDKNYGPTIILKHTYGDGKVFYSLYGHLSNASLEQVEVGQQIAKGDLLGWVGAPHENGTWAPHLHLQLMLDRLGNTVDFPGVALPSTRAIWASISPDVNLLFQLEGLKAKNIPSNEALIAYRKEHLGKGLSLQYKVPIKMVRGKGAYLMDQYGRQYLDTVNNVAHVGHEHPAVVKAGQEQMALLNTNSRYLHDNINEFAKELLATLPEELSVLHFVNSGSEANELAIRMLKTATGQQDIIASEVGYHGNTNACIAISSYKFDGKGGQGAPEHTHIIPLPDAFRGKYRGEDVGAQYAAHVQEQIDKIVQLGRGVAGFIIEPIISCGGQVELPEGFLAEAYRQVRAVGGYCISDEVQVGCGRVGSQFWGFQLHDVIPDIVTIGKPLGNGHPLAAVACTEEIANKFANGMEYFNTFGGNPVSCAIGRAVLRTVKEEGLQENARNVGNYLKEQLKALAKQYPIIGDVRGQGLFLGFELVDQDLNPLPEKVAYLANRMKDHGILMSVDGPQYNVLKIKPPIVFNQEQANELIARLTKIFAEDFMIAH